MILDKSYKKKGFVENHGEDDDDKEPSKFIEAVHMLFTEHCIRRRNASGSKSSDYRKRKSR